jgi:uncharacterized membrane protein YraQ (UPF0718 family)
LTARGGPTLSRLLQWTFVVAVLSMLLSYKSLPDAPRQAVGEISRVFVSIMLEALPFMLVGSLVGGVIEVFVSRQKLAAMLARGGRFAPVLLAAGMGVVFPVCECAVVPVVRRLLKKGVPFGAAVAYLLAGPIFNPVVAVSTAIAYRFNWGVVATRMLLGYTIAIAIGFVAGRLFRNRPVLLEQVLARAGKGRHRHGGRECEDHECAGHHDEDEHDHHHDHGDAEPAAPTTLGDKLGHALSHSANDFLEIGKFLVIGAFLAGFLRATINQEQYLRYAGQPLVTIPLMMGLAIFLNLCSEADAFVAASFRGMLPLSGQLAFMVLGPMLDMKLILMYLGLFRKRVVLTIAVSIVLAVLAACLLLEIGYKGRLS